MSRILREAAEESRRTETILVIAPTPFFTDCGGDVRIREEIRQLTDLGYRVEVCTAAGGRDVEGVGIRRVLGGLARATPGPSIRRLLSDLLLFGACVAAVRRTRPVLLHAHRHGGALIGAALGRIFRIPCVADLPCSLTGEHPAPRGAARLLAAVERWINGLPDHLVVTSGPMADDLLSRFAVPPARVTRVPDAAGPGFAAAPAPDVRRRLGVPPGHRLVVSMGVSVRPRDVEVLTETVGRVLHARPDVSFVLIGYPGERSLRSRFARSPWRDRVIFTRRLDVTTLGRILAVADLAVSPKDSPTDGNGALVHTMACGVPTVAFDTPVNREILGDLGLWVGARTRSAFAARVLQALDAGERVSRLRPALRARAEAGGTWRHNRRLLADVYGRTRAGFASRGTAA